MPALVGLIRPTILLSSSEGDTVSADRLAYAVVCSLQGFIHSHRTTRRSPRSVAAFCKLTYIVTRRKLFVDDIVLLDPDTGENP